MTVAYETRIRTKKGGLGGDNHDYSKYVEIYEFYVGDKHVNDNVSGSAMMKKIPVSLYATEKNS